MSLVATMPYSDYQNICDTLRALTKTNALIKSGDLPVLTSEILSGLHRVRYLSEGEQIGVAVVVNGGEYLFPRNQEPRSSDTTKVFIGWRFKRENSDTYEFIGWNEKITNVTENLDLEAVYGQGIPISEDNTNKFGYYYLSEELSTLFLFAYVKGKTAYQVGSQSAGNNPNFKDESTNYTSIVIKEGVQYVGSNILTSRENLYLPSTLYNSIDGFAFGYYNGSLFDNIYFYSQSGETQAQTLARYAGLLRIHSDGQLTFGLAPDGKFYIDDIELKNMDLTISTKIANLSLQNLNCINSINFTNTITFTSTVNLSGCKNLTSIIFPEELTESGTSHSTPVLSYSNIQELDIPGYFTNINKLNNSKIKKLTLNEGTTTISYGAMQQCSDLIVLNIPNSLTTISAYNFQQHTNLARINIKDVDNWASVDISTDGGYSLSNPLAELYCNNERVDSLVLNATTVKNSFTHCRHLKTLEINSSVTNISSSAFFGCTNLSKVIFHEGLDNIKSYTFKSCSSLEEIILPHSMKILESNSFESTGLKTVKINKEIEQIENGCFRYNLLLELVDFTDLTDLEDLTKITFGGGLFNKAPSSMKILFSSAELAAAAKEQENLASYSSFIHYVGEEI